MRQYSTKYFGWITSFIINLFLVGVLVYAVKFAITAQRQAMFDVDNWLLLVVVILVLAIVLWETIIIFDFLLKDVRGTVILGERDMTIVRGNDHEILYYTDLTKIEFAGRQVGSRALTAGWTYAKLTFNKRVLFITSLTMTNEETSKEFRTSSISARERKFFELIG